MAEQVNIQVLIDASKSAKTINETNDALRKMQAALENTKIGSKQFKALQAQIDVTNKKIKDATESTSFFSSVFPGLSKGLDALKKGTNGFGLALKATGIGLVTAAIALLIEGFKKLEKPMLIIEGLARSVGAAMNAIINLDFGALVDVATGSVVQLVQAENDLAKQTAKLSTEQAKLNGQVALYERIADDTTASAEVRLKALQDAMVAQQTLSKLEVENAEKNIALIKEKIRLEGDSLELQKELADFETKRAESLGKAAEKEQDLRNKTNAILEEQRKVEEDNLKEAQKRAEEAQRKRLESEKDYQKRLRDLKEKNALEDEKDETKRAELKAAFDYKRAQEEIDALNISDSKKNELRAELEISYQDTLDNIREAARKKQEEADKILAEKQRVEDEKKAEERKKQLESEADVLKKYREENITAAAENAQEALRIEMERELEAVKDFENFEQVRTEIVAKYARLQSELRKAQQAQDLENTRAFLSNAAGLFDESSDAYKALAIAETTISTYQAAQQAYQSMVGIPYVGPVLGAAAAATAIAAGIKNVQAITQVKTPEQPKYAAGGILSGPSHSQGGIQTPFGELEGNEIVLTSGVTRNPSLRAAASKLNRLGGGVSFADESVGSDSRIGELIDEVRSLNQRPVKTYVTEQDVTDSQRRVSRLKANAIFGN